MADKEATVYIVDLGKSMGETRSEGPNQPKETQLTYGMRYVWDKITTTMIAERKTWNVGVVGLRSDATSNPSEDDEGYTNISILQELGPMQMPQLRKLQEAIIVNETNSGDAISAIIIAIEMIVKFTKKLKYFRKIVLMTDGRGLIDADDLDEISKKLNEEEIELVIVGVDFDDAEFGYREENKNSIKSENEALLKSLSDQCSKTVFGTMAEAVQNIAIPRPKTTKPYNSYSGQLTLGDPENYETAMCIDVERYFRTHAATAPSASFFVSKFPLGESTQSSHTINAENDTMMGGIDENDLAVVKNERTYVVKDVSSTSGSKHVTREDLARGYEYGRTAVHISETDQNVTKLETKKSFSIIGFVPTEKYETHLNMGDAGIIIAQKTNDKAKMALSSLIHALHELDSYAIARIVLKDGKDPQILLLMPSIEPDLECLIDMPLPFAEDVRWYRFPPLDKVITVSGSILTKHRNLPTDELSNAMDKYVDSMDISTFGKDDDGKPSEYLTLEDSYSPVIHRINQAIRRRAISAGESIQPAADILMKYSEPPVELVTAVESDLKKVIAAANVKHVPKKAKGRRGRSEETPMSGLNVSALLHDTPKTLQISVTNAIPEFKQMMARADELGVEDKAQEVFLNASKQMGGIIRKLIQNSFGESEYGVALANLRVMRDELIGYDLPEIYNEYVEALKKDVLGDKLGGDNRTFFWELRKQKLGLIDEKQQDNSKVTAEMAAEFYNMNTRKL